jgi:hypothetical protein
MTINRKLYPPARSVWQVMRQEALERAGYVCEECGLPDAKECFNPDKPHPFYEQGTPYRMYLQLAHRKRYRTWDREADTVMLCPPCHGTFDTKYQRKKEVKQYVPVGQVMVWVWYKGQRCLAAESRWYYELVEVIASFDVGMKFEVQAEMLMSRVGSGVYCREEQGVRVLREVGACRSFGALLQDVFAGVVG